MPGGVEDFLLNSGWAGIVIIALVWEVRERRAENRDLRAQIDAMRDAVLKERDDTIKTLINRGGLHHGGHANG